MPLVLTIFLESVTHTDRSVAQILSVHGLYCSVTRLKVSKVYEGETLRVARFWIPHYFGSLQDHTECAEGVVQ